MNKQMSLSFIHDELKEVKTHKREFLEKMDAILPWEQLYKLVKPCYYEGARGNKPYDRPCQPDCVNISKTKS